MKKKSTDSKAQSPRDVQQVPITSTSEGNRFQVASSRIIGLGLLLIVAVFWCYSPAFHGDFIWDDDAYVTKNPLLSAPDGLRRIWFSRDAPSQYFPLTYTLLRLEYSLWKLNPTGYHLVNIAIHVLNCFLVWRLMVVLKIPGGFAGAAVFALHPVHVESVAWITELKNVLMAFFFLLSLLFWVRFLDAPPARKWKQYGWSLFLYALALFSKTTACTLPAALIIVLWWRNEKTDLRKWMQVMPYVVMGLLMGLFCIWWEKHNQGTQGREFHLSWIESVLISSRAIWFYAAKLVWPVELAFSYPKWKLDPSMLLQYLPLAGCMVVGLVLCRLWKVHRRAAPLGVIFFVSTLSPILGFIPLYTFRYTYVADHYQYVASLGLILLISGWAVGKLREKFRSNLVLSGVFLPILIVLGHLTWKQAHIYQGMEPLWNDTIRKNPESWMAYDNLGTIHYARGDLQTAHQLFSRAVEIHPGDYEGHNNLGVLYYVQGKYAEAVNHYEMALREKPNHAETHNNYASALFMLGQLDLARNHYEAAIRLNPNYTEARANLKMLLEKTQRR